MTRSSPASTAPISTPRSRSARPLDRRHDEGRSLRTGPPFVARHLPWYIDPLNLSDEDRYYREHADPVISNWDRDELPRWKQRWLTALRPARPTDVI